MKVTFKARDIYQDGILVGELQGTRQEVWVVLKEWPVARFKYIKPTSSAKHFIKFLLTKFTPDQIIGAIGFDGNEKEAPLTWAKSQGYQEKVS